MLWSALFLFQRSAKSLTTVLGMQSAYKSSFTKFDAGCADVYLVPMFSDNYGYIFCDKGTNLSGCVDPAQPDVIQDTIKHLDLNNEILLCTHKHADHAGGNLYMKDWLPDLKIIATKYEPIPGVTIPAGDGDIFHLGNLTIETIYTPCHTKGHVVYLVRKIVDGVDEGSPLLFCGDTLFVGGCGRFFEGTPDEMLQNMDKLSELPSDTLVFCAHEYTLSNFNFLHSVDPHRVSSKLDWVTSQREKNLPTIPRYVENDHYNIFLNIFTVIYMWSYKMYVVQHNRGRKRS